MHFEEINYRENTECTRWSALHTRYQHEKAVESLLAAKGFETFLPTYDRVRRWKDRNKKIAEALFPGYLFVANVDERRLQVLATPGVCAVVSVGGMPAIIPDHEIDMIRKSVADPSKVQPHPCLERGDWVRVAWGPLAGVEGILVRIKDSFRLVVSIEILGRAAAVEIDAPCVERMKRDKLDTQRSGSAPPTRGSSSSPSQ
jgi:transcription antitermination factor NusG